MLQTLEHATVEEASTDLLRFVLAPENWVQVDGAGESDVSSGKWIEYSRLVDSLRIRASVDLTHQLGVFLHIAFKAPGLTPMRAAGHLEDFLRGHFPLVPNSEWQVELDGRKWIHFRRRYTGEVLRS